MKRAMRLATVLAGVLGGLMLMAPPAGAGVIVPVNSAVNGFTPMVGSAVSISIYQDGADVTNTWRPTWTPAAEATADKAALTVHVVVNSNGVPTVPAIISLVPPVAVNAASFTGTVNPFINPATATLTTSAYPGRCTNYGLHTDLTPDFEFSSTGVVLAGGQTGFPLISRDCGGMAVLNVTVDGVPYTFVLPQDSNGNGIPDMWETVFCPGNTCPTGREDADGGPVNGAPSGDGFAALDEYRGFIVSGAHVSTDPRQKNLFVHLVNPQCGAVSLLGGTPGTTAYPTTQGASLFDGVSTLISGTQIHFLNYAPFAQNVGPNPEWVDNFLSYSDATGIMYSANGPQMDRQVNANAIYPILDAVSGLTVQKGLRVIECVDELVPSPLGAAGVGSPNGPDNAVIYTTRIVNYINHMIDAGLSRPVKLFTYQYSSGVLIPVLQYTGPAAQTPSTEDRNRIISAAIAYYVAMEVAHSTRLTPTLEGTSRTSYGYHHAPGSGSNVDQAIVNKVDKNGGFNSFYIPSVYTSGDQGSFKLRN